MKVSSLAAQKTRLLEKNHTQNEYKKPTPNGAE